MAQHRSFKEYVANRFYNELFAAVSDFLRDHRGNLNVSSRSVRTIDNVELSDIEVKHVYVDNMPGMKIAFEILLEAEFELSETDRRTDRFDEKSEWFKLSCSGDLSHNLDDFIISHIEEYNVHNQHQNPLSDSLVPIIKKEQLETVARSFLELYYPEALYAPTPIDPLVLTERMGISFQLKHITPDFSTFGQIFFAECEATYYDKKSDSYKTLSVERGTIFVDPDAYFL